MTRTALLCLATLSPIASLPAAMLTAPLAHAEAGPTDAAVAAASRHYEEGTRAHAAGDYVEAARAFAKADALVPDPAALEAALVAVLKTDEAVLGMELVSRVARHAGHQRLNELATTARQRFGGATGRIVIHCDDCSAQLDGESIERGTAVWVLAGSHEVLLTFPGRQDEERQTVVVEPTSLVTILPVGGAPPPPEPPPPDTETEAGPSPVWFWVGLGLTAGAGAATIASGVDTIAKHDDFAAMPTLELSEAGQDAELRTNVLIGVTAGLAAVTAAVGIFVVDWDGGSAGAWLGPSSVGVRGAF